jgi:hypothetical protein
VANANFRLFSLTSSSNRWNAVPDVTLRRRWRRLAIPTRISNTAARSDAGDL